MRALKAPFTAATVAMPLSALRASMRIRESRPSPEKRTTQELRSVFRKVLAQERFKGESRRKNRYNCVERFPILKRNYVKVLLSFILLVRCEVGAPMQFSP